MRFAATSVSLDSVQSRCS